MLIIQIENGGISIMKNNIAVLHAGLAKKLIKMGYIVRDIQPNRENPLKTVFFFDATEEIKNIINDYRNRKREAKGENAYEHKNISGSISSEQ